MEEFSAASAAVEGLEWRPHRYSKAVYPLLGLRFFLAHPSLWWTVLGPFICLITVSIVVVIVLFAATLYPQYLMLAKGINKEWLCWLLAVLLVLTECLIAILITAQLTFDRMRIRIFNRVFELCNVSLRLRQFDNPLKISYGKLASWISGRFFLLGFAVTLLLTMPLNLIPVAGTALWCCINGLVLAWGNHGVYFEAKGLSPQEQFNFVWSRKKDYISFGAVAMLLDLVPLLDVLFFYTSIVGAALWAVEYEYDRVLDMNEGESEAIGQFLNSHNNPTETNTSNNNNNAHTPTSYTPTPATTHNNNNSGAYWSSSSSYAPQRTQAAAFHAPQPPHEQQQQQQHTTSSVEQDEVYQLSSNNNNV